MMDRSFPIIETDLGKRLSPKELSALIGLNYSTIRKYYQKFGGIKIGNRYVFFERKVVDAIQTAVEVNRPNAEGGPANTESIRDEEGRQRVGNETEEETNKRLMKEDRHGIFSE
jgi:hypothetical protein